ncbi:PIN domain-containing protein [Streptomyces himalayensis]|uniref:PIN domain-containing protein n=1 Tax=Streptomyces himalayensis subsp. himalayensis TaxID=2756131 RepID=A0A7W0DQV9_9ACTN|nr:PIN domain-containing protein [Streptomyces himalayensis]MBA2948834.1 PIN domain-containing protein [Streptomyces himalayensis subsp. himalayensis]
MINAVLDACVLFPNVLRDTMLSLAERDLFRPLWSLEILSEVRRNVLAKRPVDAQALDRTIALMNSAFDDALVEDWEPLVPDIELRDPDDRHVLAAAISGRAHAIVTFNTSDFLGPKPLPGDIEIFHPDAFLIDRFDESPTSVISALTDQSKRYRRPPMDLGALLARLDRCGVPEFGEEVRRHIW